MLRCRGEPVLGAAFMAGRVPFPLQNQDLTLVRAMGGRVKQQPAQDWVAAVGSRRADGNPPPCGSD